MLIRETDVLSRICIQNKNRLLDWEMFTQNLVRSDVVLDVVLLSLGHHFQGQKVKGQGHEAALLTAVLARQATAGVGVGTCWP